MREVNWRRSEKGTSGASRSRAKRELGEEGEADCWRSKKHEVNWWRSENQTYGGAKRRNQIVHGAGPELKHGRSKKQKIAPLGHRNKCQMPLPLTRLLD